MLQALKVVMAVAAVAAPLGAVAGQDRNRFGHDAIEAGRYDEAEAMLRADLAINPDMPEALINLAAIYARTNRGDAAQALYARVLATDNVSMLLTPTTALDSHAIAQRGMRKLETARMAAR
ncbi:tetratricopeptide repeat protein [Sphingomonas japonica]|uniref:Thioredoxin-like negative regulator of GroEL n=1 Tax=Sphingomonas japonica TaxID=511662 RepID=A0ABX0U1R5_9SPHN|nr:tetratricopeptide repeat protein [Sphingomonas japonica]NIJ24509.1 thioredoxin-like negative regulator of GroEL [Sphingomonas japonica]